MGFPETALALVVVFWIFFGIRFFTNHLRVTRERGPGSRKKDLRAPASMLGLLLEGVALTVVFTWRKPLGNTPDIVAIAALAIAALSAWLASEAVRHLGKQWRIKAVVTEDHQLVKTGPYGMVRHPIYLSLMGMVIAFGLLLTKIEGLATALVIYVIGTEIRVRAEDSILRKRFGREFDDYESRVRAYMPFIR